jgi:hypothetical protein
MQSSFFNLVKFIKKAWDSYFNQWILFRMKIFQVNLKFSEGLILYI